MEITIIGAGNMGSAFVKQLVRAGHQVRIASRDGAKAAQLAAAHPGAKAVEIAGAADGADAIVLATGYDSAIAALSSVGDLQGKVVIDITNPLTPDYMGPGRRGGKGLHHGFGSVADGGRRFWQWPRGLGLCGQRQCRCQENRHCTGSEHGL